MHGMSGPEVRLRPGEEPLRAANIRRVVALFRPHQGQVAVATFLVLITALLGVVNPLMQKVIFDDVFSGRHVVGAFGLRDFGLLAFYVAIMVTTPIASSLIGIVQTYVTTVIGQEVIQELRNRLYAH